MMDLLDDGSDGSRWVLPAVLASQAQRRPDAPWFIGVGNETVTYGRMHEDVRRVAGLLQSLGVRRGDRVVIFAGNHADFVRAWLGVQTLGAVSVLLNTELRGAFLSHQLGNTAAGWVIADAALLPMLDDVAGITPPRQVLAIGDEAWTRWHEAEPYAGPLPRAQDIACVMYTSGTSGPAKGVLMPHAHCALYGLGAIEALQITEADRYYIVLPLFHSNGLLMQLAATLLAGIPAIVRPRFSASEWLEDIRRHGATLTSTLGVLASFIAAQPAGDLDRDHALRALCNAPNQPQLEQVFSERFGVASVVSGYGMTEVNIPVWGRVGHSTPGAAGWVSRWFELIVADPETDCELPRGQVGEILVRPKVPFGFMQGYLGMPEKTLEAWRNLWFHTGDGGTMDADGLLTFTDRLKDCIRRRGENIAPNEVEALLARLPGVAEIAAFPVPSDVPGGEDELMLAIIAEPGGTLDLEALGAAAEALLPRFARPRYLQQLDELPKTATGKVQRAVLRQRGCARALDRGDGRSPA